MEDTYPFYNDIHQSLSEAEIVALGEEIADVFIYSTRLCDICGVDFGAAVFSVSNSREDRAVRSVLNNSWRDTSFETIQSIIFPSLLEKFRSPRQMVFKLQYFVGQLSDLFSKYQERLSSDKFAGWTSIDVDEFANILGHIGVVLFSLSAVYRLDVGTIVAKKFGKNERKYPVSLAKGSSAKYTAYVPKGDGCTWIYWSCFVAFASIAGFYVGQSRLRVN